jgi:3-oxoacyl-(acyl-carrier-protein) synthase
MSSRFRFVVEVELERTEGKFAGRDEMADAIQNALDDANPSQVDGIGNDGTSTYEVDPADYPIMQRVHPQTGEPIGPPIDTRRLSHAGHDHPATAAARAQCRAQRAAYLRDHPEEN